MCAFGPEARTRFDLDVTVSSPYDTPQRYADAFRATSEDGAVVYGVRAAVARPRGRAAVHARSVRRSDSRRCAADPGAGAGPGAWLGRRHPVGGLARALSVAAMGWMLLCTLAAGACIPLGGWLASVERIRPKWLEQELRHFVMAFGGGVLLAAVTLVLLPQGVAAVQRPGLWSAGSWPEASVFLPWSAGWACTSRRRPRCWRCCWTLCRSPWRLGGHVHLRIACGALAGGVDRPAKPA